MTDLSKNAIKGKVLESHFWIMKGKKEKRKCIMIKLNNDMKKKKGIRKIKLQGIEQNGVGCYWAPP